MKLEEIYKQKEEFVINLPEVYLISYIREDIMKYVKDNPYKYLIKIKPKLYTILVDEMRNPLGRKIEILDVKIKPDYNIGNSYTIFKCKQRDYPDLDTWWNYLSLNKKTNIYLKNK